MKSRQYTKNKRDVDTLKGLAMMKREDDFKDILRDMDLIHSLFIIIVPNRLQDNEFFQNRILKKLVVFSSMKL